MLENGKTEMMSRKTSERCIQCCTKRFSRKWVRTRTKHKTANEELQGEQRKVSKTEVRKEGMNYGEKW